TEDCWVANSFTVAAGGTHLTGVNFIWGEANTGAALPSEVVTATIYTGTSLTSPAGLSRIVSSTTSATITGAVDSLQSITLANPVDLPVGQIFWAALLIRGVPGTLFPYSSDFGLTGGPAPLGHSFFDVGATQGAPYNLDVNTNATVLGASHPVVTLAQDAG